MNGKPTMFMVLRYMGCTICRYDIHCLTERYNEFVEKGVNVMVVMQSKPEIVQRDLNGQTLQFHFICDVEQQIYKDLEIKPAKNGLSLIGPGIFKALKKAKASEKLGYKHGDYEGIEEQLPAFFYVQPDLTVEVAHYAKNIADMPNIDAMLGMIK